MNTLILSNEFLYTIFVSMAIMVLLTGFLYVFKSGSHSRWKARSQIVFAGSLALALAGFIPKALSEKGMINYHREQLIHLLETKGITITGGEVDIEIHNDTLMFRMINDTIVYSFPIQKEIYRYVVETDKMKENIIKPTINKRTYE